MAEPFQSSPSSVTDSAIARYRLLAELGRGGMADVYLAMTAGPGGFSKLLVLKQLRMGDDPALVRMFLDEAKLAARVSHPNIVQTFEVVQEGARAFMVMEFLDGGSLSRLRRAAARVGERLPLELELRVLLDSLLGLHYAHELKGYDGKPLGVVHRDFTPQNIMVTYDGDVKIVDFGIAKALDQQGQTAAGMFKGKLTYVPPEQLMGQPVDRRADVFAAGVMLFEAVTGTSPWDGLNNAAITHALASGRIPRLLEVDTAHPELAAICDQAMAVHPDDRFSTADEMRIALEDYVREHGLRTDRAQLGEYAQTRLADVRKRTHEIIDQQLKHQGALPRADTLAQNLPTLDGVTPPPVAKVLGRSVPELMSSEAMPDTGRERQSELERPSSRTPLVMALAGLVMVLLGVVTWLVLRPAAPAAVVAPKVAVVETPPPVVPPPAPVPTPAPAPVVVQAPTTPPPPERVTVRVSASPPNARVFVDDLEMPSNPFVGEFPRDSAVHELRVTATGHVEVRRAVQFEREVAIDIALAQVPQVIRVPVRAPPPAPAPAQPRVEPPPTVPAPTAPQPAPDDAYFGPAPTKPKTDDATYFGPAKKKQPKPALDTNIEFK